jgi:hypothetical protein
MEPGFVEQINHVELDLRSAARLRPLVDGARLICLRVAPRLAETARHYQSGFESIHRISSRTSVSTESPETQRLAFRRRGEVEQAGEQGVYLSVQDRNCPERLLKGHEHRGNLIDYQFGPIAHNVVTAACSEDAAPIGSGLVEILMHLKPRGGAWTRHVFKRRGWW